MNLRGDPFFQNPNQKLQRFLPLVGILGEAMTSKFILNLTDLKEGHKTSKKNLPLSFDVNK